MIFFLTCSVIWWNVTFHHITEHVQKTNHWHDDAVSALVRMLKNRPAQILHHITLTTPLQFSNEPLVIPSWSSPAPVQINKQS